MRPDARSGSPCDAQDDPRTDGSPNRSIAAARIVVGSDLPMGRERFFLVLMKP